MYLHAGAVLGSMQRADKQLWIFYVSPAHLYKEAPCIAEVLLSDATPCPEVESACSKGIQVDVELA